MVFGHALIESVHFQAKVQCDPHCQVIAFYKVEDKTNEIGRSWFLRANTARSSKSEIVWKVEETNKKEVQNAEVKKLVLVLVLMISVRTSISVSERESILSYVYIGLNKYI